MTKLALLISGYVVTGWLGLKIPYSGSHVTLIWLPTGIAVAALLRFGWGVWPGVFLGALIVNLSIDSSWPLATGIALGNTLGPLVTAGWLKRVGFHPTFDRQRDIGLLVAAAAAGMAVSASGGCASLYLAGLLPLQALDSAWLSWWMGDFVGVLLVGPLLLTLNRENILQLSRPRREVLLWVLVAGLVAWFAFIHDFGQSSRPFSLAYLTLPLFAWAALRFGITGAALAGLSFSLIAAWSAATGHGAFPQSDVHSNLVLLWSYMATTVLTGLLIVALQAERLRVETTLRESELRLRTIIDTQPECVKMLTADGVVLQMNRAGLAMVEADSADQVIGLGIVELVAEPYRGPFHALTQRVFGGESGRLEFKIRGLKGAERWLHSHTVPMRNAQGIIVSALSVTRDVTHRKHAEEQLRIAACAFESQEGMMITDANSVILRVNRAFTRITGYTAEEAVGQTPRLLQSDRHDKSFYDAMWRAVHSTGGWQGEVWDRRKGGEVYPKWLTISAVKDDEGSVSHYIGTHFDITERKRAEEKIRELAFFDQLTGLPNRTLLLDRLKQAMVASSRDGSYGALLFIDLDHFKTLNDTLGHDMGDLLLRQVAYRLTACVREGDTVARLGGDEFVVVLVGLSNNGGDAADSTEMVAGKMLVELNRIYQLGSIARHSTPSIGVTLFEGQQVAIDELMKQADLAMYRSKAAGRNAVRFFDPAMESAVMERAALEDDFRQAIEKKQFLLHYQAQVAGEGHVTGVEVLLRWLHPQRGMVSPADFIPMAEETGLILPLGRWVLETACAQLAVWAKQEEMSDLVIAVNVSAHQFRQADFVEQVLTVLHGAGANPCRLKLELTESLLVSNVEEIIEKMMVLKARGVGFSLDDFGTGYSSLSYLKRLPLDQLKIDQSFVRDILRDPNDAAIARTIIALAQSLGLDVMAEGVETAAQRDFLAGAGCHAYQGYFFSRPLTLERFEQFVQQPCLV